MPLGTTTRATTGTPMSTSTAEKNPQTAIIGKLTKKWIGLSATQAATIKKLPSYKQSALAVAKTTLTIEQSLVSLVHSNTPFYINYA